MKVAIDKTCIEVLEDYNYDFVYLFDNEPLKDLLKLNLHCVKYDKCGSVDINLTNYDIDCVKKTTISDKNWNKLPEYIEHKIGIIIPNYNYEHTIEKCLTSIFNQTYQNYEIIFVDDCSTDNSIQIVKQTFSEWLNRPLKISPDVFMSVEANKQLNSNKLKIIQLKQKRLNGGARNEAYLHVSNDVDYIYYVDSDDWLNNETALERINKSLQSKPDVLFVGMEDYRKGIQKLCYIPNYKDKYEAMQGWSGSCGKVIKKELATRQDCLYAEGTLKEDRNQHFRVCIKMNSFKCLKEPVYVWNRENQKSITTIRENVLWGTSTIRHLADTKQLYLEEKGKDRKTDMILKKRVERCKTEIREGGDRQW